MEVMFKSHHYSYIGRNGIGKCYGLSIEPYGSGTAGHPAMITIQPINSKESIVSGCSIDIPTEYLSEVCAAMQGDLLGKVLDQVHDRLPTLLGLDPSLDIEIARRLQR